MEPNLCILMDFENIAAGAEKEGHGRFDTNAVMTRLKEKGRILIARSYGDWGRFAKYKQEMLEHAIQAVELTSYRGQEKNRADIALAVDAMELAFTRDYLDTFVLMSGDSDFTPLVMRLRELNRRVIGIGTRRSSSRLLVESCDEFIFYESIKRGRKVAATPAPTSDAVETLSKEDALALLVETIEGLQKDEPGPVLAGRVKQSVLRKHPTFDETEYGYAGFTRFLEDARDKKLLILTTDGRAGGYRVDLPGEVGPGTPDEEEEEQAPSEQPLVPGEAGRLRGVLMRAGVDPLSALHRHIVVYEFVDHVTDRARKKKRNTLIYTVGDVARRTRHTDPPVTSHQVRSVLQAVYQAGELLHADGRPIRKEAAPFALRGDAEDILRALRGYYVSLLLEEGERLADARALSILLWGDEEHMVPAEEMVAWMQHDRRSAREPEGEGALEGREDAPDDEAAPAEGGPAGSDPAEASAGDGSESGRRRRRRRGSRRRREGGAEAGAGEGGDEGAEGDDEEAPAPLADGEMAAPTPADADRVEAVGAGAVEATATPVAPEGAADDEAEAPAPARKPTRRRAPRKPKVSEADEG